MDIEEGVWRQAPNQVRQLLPSYLLIFGTLLQMEFNIELVLA